MTAMDLLIQEMFLYIKFILKLLKEENPKKIRQDIKTFRKDYQELQYCFKEGFRGYDYHTLV